MSVVEIGDILGGNSNLLNDLNNLALATNNDRTVSEGTLTETIEDMTVGGMKSGRKFVIEVLDVAVTKLFGNRLITLEKRKRSLE